ncbi:MAG: hypothetical protein PHC61_19140 [Chitinivibrionales bacterium]|nr:hypothetical protein [Chitinivibrionales bacterium]
MISVVKAEILSSIKNSRAFRLLFIWLVACSLPTWCDVIKGTVYDSSSNAVLSGCLVAQNGTALQTTTDAQGKFSLTIASTSLRQARGVLQDKSRSDGIRLFSIRGALVYQNNSNGNANTTPGLPKGLYIRVDGQGPRQQAGKAMILDTRDLAASKVFQTEPQAQPAAKKTAAALTLVFSKLGYTALEKSVPVGDTTDRSIGWCG